MSKQASAMWQQKGDVFVGLDPARGPWSIDHCHGGPVTALVARAAEQLMGTDQKLVRLSIDLLRAVPMSGIRVTAEPVKRGRQVSTARISVVDTEDRLCASATSMHLVEHDLGEVPTAPFTAIRRADAKPGYFGTTKPPHGAPFFGNFVEVAYPADDSATPGSTTKWMKSLPLLVDEEPSPFQRLCPLSDCGNGISRNADIDEYQFINPDITVVAHRSSASTWLASTARSEWQANGIGLASAVIHDEDGPIASVLQSLVLRRTG